MSAVFTVGTTYEGWIVNESVVHPAPDDSEDEDSSTSPKGHSHVPDDGDHPSVAPSANPSTETPDQEEASSALEEIDDSPVRTKNS